MLELPSLPSGVRILSDEEAARLKRLRPDLPMSLGDCITCKGAKTFRWFDPILVDGVRLVADWKCNCEDQWILHRWFLHCGIDKTYQRLSWEDVSAEPGAVAKVKDYLAHSDAYVEAGCGLILYGSMGSGKTLLTMLALKELSCHWDCYFTTFAELIDTFTAGWHDPEDKRWFYRRIKNAGVLAIDDVGREQKGANFPRSTLDEVLRHRVAASRPTIITTNLNLEDLQRGYGTNIMSLLHERSTTYRFTGEDFRERSRLRLDEEILRKVTRPVVVG